MCIHHKTKTRDNKNRQAKRKGIKARHQTSPRQIRHLEERCWLPLYKRDTPPSTDKKATSPRIKKGFGKVFGGI